MKNKFNKVLGLLFALVLFAGWCIPTGEAMAETETVVSEVVKEVTPRSGYEEAARILDENLKATGIEFNAEQRLYDFYGKFDAGEQEEISAWIAEKEEESNISIRIFVAEMDMYVEKQFLEECTDLLCDNGYAKEDLAIMLLNLDAFDRGACIQGYGICETRLNDDRIEYILDDVFEWFLKDDYVYGLKLFAEEAAYYATASEVTGSAGSADYVGTTDSYVDSMTYVPYYKDNSFKGKVHRMPWPLIVLVPFGVAVVGILLMKQNSGSRMTANGRTYMDNTMSGLTARKDDYVRTSVSKIYSPRNSGISGGSGGRSSGGGGRSSGGRSHSGGSRRF